LFEFVRETRREIAKVTWPTRRETMITTVLIVGMAIIVGLFYFGVDYVLGIAISKLRGMREHKRKRTERKAHVASLVRYSRLFGLREKGGFHLRETALKKGLEEFFSEILVRPRKWLSCAAAPGSTPERKFFPGYVLIKMDLTTKSWHLVKNTPKVTAF